MARLSKRTIDALQPAQAGDLVVWDTNPVGFGVRVKPSGRKSYLVQYRNAQGRSRRLTLGSHGTLTVEQARDEAVQVLAAAKRGADPVEDRQRLRQAETVGELAERYLAEHAEVKKKTRSVAEDRRLLRAHLLPALGRRKVAELTRGDVSKLHHELRNTPIEANRTLALLSKMLNLAEQWGLRPDASNPCRHVQKFRERKRMRFLSARELLQLGEVIAEIERAGTEMPSALLAVRLLLLTGARLSEILDLRWEDLDAEHGVARLPDSKTGPKLLPLGAPVLELLARAPRIPGNPHVVPGRRPGARLVGLQHVWERLRKRAGLDGVRLHDLRHSFASVGAAAGLGLPIIGKILGHEQASTTHRYAHLSDDPVRAAADRIAGEIATALAGRRGGIVIPINPTGS